MITGAIKNQIDQVWNAFWAGGMVAPGDFRKEAVYHTPEDEA